MKILTRYVVFDLLKVFLMILSGLTLVIFIGLLGKQAVDKGLGLGPLLEMTPYLLPEAMQFAVPGTMLLATTYVFGRLSTYNEIVAMKALGISPMAVIWPTLFIATIVSFLGVYINNLAVSWGKRGQERVLVESIEDILLGQLKINRTFSLGRFNINVRSLEGRKLIKPIVVIESNGDAPPMTLRAMEAELAFDPQAKTLTIRSNDFEMNGPITVSNPRLQEQVFSYEDVLGTSSKSMSPSNYALADIPPAVAECEQRIRELDESMSAQASFALATGEFLSLAPQYWKWREKELIGQKERLQRLHTEPWRRWANGFSCLCFVLVGAPMAIRMKHAEFLAIFFVCFLPILLVYYPLLAVSVKQAKDGAFPPPAVWAGNIVLALWGIWLLRRVIRY